MKKLAKAILIACLCFAVAGCGNDNAEKGELEALKQQVADLQEENEELKQQPAEEEQVENSAKEFTNDYYSLTYNENNFDLEENDNMIALYTKLPDNGGHNTLFGTVMQDNTEFETVDESDIADMKKILCLQVCQGFFELDEGVEIEEESYDDQIGYCMKLSDGSECYTRVLSYGRQLAMAFCRLCPYSDTVNEELLETYKTVISLVPEEVPEKVEEDKTASAANDEAPAKEDPEDGSIPREYKSALSKAASYSKTMHMSKAGLYEQLTSEYGEQFSAEAAQYAIDNVDADWKANALEKAKSYSSTMHMSKAGLYEQLISEFGEQFTAEEAQYAVDNVNADWKANALEKAKSYQDTMNMSPEAIRDQLVSEYGERFTAEEADYAIANLN